MGHGPRIGWPSTSQHIGTATLEPASANGPQEKLKQRIGRDDSWLYQGRRLEREVLRPAVCVATVVTIFEDF
jgi:hypothetical protein